MEKGLNLLSLTTGFRVAVLFKGRFSGVAIILETIKKDFSIDFNSFVVN